MIFTGDIVQTYAYGRPYRKAEVLGLEYGQAVVRIIPSGEVTKIDTDFLVKIN